MDGHPPHIVYVADLIWSVADFLRGDFKRSEYGSVIMPFTVLRRMECLRVDNGHRLVDRDANPDAHGVDEGQSTAIGFPLDEINADPARAAEVMHHYLAGLPDPVNQVMRQFDFGSTVDRLNHTRLLFTIINRFASIDLGPAMSAQQMGFLFEDLVRRCAEQSSETAGEHFTPRDVAQLMADLIVTRRSAHTTAATGGAATIYDPVCGTGGLLHQTQDALVQLNPSTAVSLSGQEINGETWAICQSSMLMRGEASANVVFGNVLQHDGHEGHTFDYLVASPPLGVNWKRAAQAVRYEQQNSGPTGRFAAGLPRVSDASLLFLQHMLAKMKPVNADGSGGSRIAIVFNQSAMYAGGAGSGEAAIRRWIMDNDWLEAVIAMPDHLYQNTALSAYLWLLSNRKTADRAGKVVLLNAKDMWQQVRVPLGDKRKYFSQEHIAEIRQLIDNALSLPAAHPRREQVRIVPVSDLTYRRIVIEQPLRLHFELTSETLAALTASAPVRRAGAADTLLAVLQPLLGSNWTTKQKTLTTVRAAATAHGHTLPGGKTFETAVRNALGIRSDTGEIQRTGGSPEPDPELRQWVNLPIDADPEHHLRRNLHPDSPLAWIDHDKTQLGCEIAPSLFYVPELDGVFEKLDRFAHAEPTRITVPQDEDPDSTDRPKHLRAQDLHSADSAAELPDAAASTTPLTPCSGGTLVGRPGNWRLLPPDFGDAVTSLIVLHPIPGTGRILCEWLNSRKDTGRFPSAREILDSHVPADLITDDHVDDFLEDIEAGRRALRDASAGILPNVFAAAERDVEVVRSSIRAAAHEAGLVSELVRPLGDPVWRAESSYPFHVAALARRYRISTQPAEQQDGLLKLGEGLTRMLGVPALAELIAANGFTRDLRKLFRTGATFGTWLTVLRLHAATVPAASPPGAIGDAVTLRAQLGVIKDFRNSTHHAHGVRADHEVKEDVDALEPQVVSALSAVGWLTGVHWDWVQTCKYLDDDAFRIIGHRLRGAHPSWEPFEHSSTDPLRPDRIYVTNPLTRMTPLDLWPLAAVTLCAECRNRELFLINHVDGDEITLRSLEEHTMQINYVGP